MSCCWPKSTALDLVKRDASLLLIAATKEKPRRFGQGSLSEGNPNGSPPNGLVARAIAEAIHGVFYV